MIGYIVIILVLLFMANALLIWNTKKTVSILFDGFYSADPVFCEEGGLDMMVIYFDHGDGYIMIKTESGDVLLNEVFQYKLKSKTGLAYSIQTPQIYEIQFNGIEDQDFFPSIQMLEYVPATQRIKLYNEDDQKIYAVLYKNNAVSDVKALLDSDNADCSNQE